MLLKFLVLAGVAIYCFNSGEIGLSLLALAALVPSVGLLLAIVLVVIFIIKGWYYSAAIVGALVIFNLVGNAILNKNQAAPVQNDNP